MAHAYEAVPSKAGDRDDSVGESSATGWLSWLTFSWMSELLQFGSRQTLHLKHYPPLPSQYSASVSYASFKRNWTREIRSGKPNLWRALLRTYWVTFTISGVLQGILLLITFVNAYSLQSFITCIEEKHAFQDTMAWVAVLAGTKLVQCLLNAHGSAMAAVVDLQV